MGREYFVTKLMNGGVSGSPKMNWWMRHGSCVSLYLQRWDSERLVEGKRERDVLKCSMDKHSVEWSPRNSAASALMREHVMLELGMVDTALPANFDERNLEAVTTFLCENVVKQAALFGEEIQDFPVNRFKCLFVEHVKLFIESVRWHTTPNDRKYAACEERRLANTLELAAFSTEWF